MTRFIVAAVAASLLSSASQAAEVWINELHYDNAGGDVGEFVEVAGTAGTDLAGWTLSLYNGGSGAPYTSLGLDGVIPDSGASGFGALAFGFAGIQNGGADGVALINGSGDVTQFLSYEGQITATAGLAAGLDSEDIGVFESADTPVGHSLQLVGSGDSYASFFWSEAAVASPGSLNDGQSLSAVPLPAALPMFMGALGGLLFVGRQRRNSSAVSDSC